ncbi:MAG: 2-C-methyl-D-erythritol 4-phosphate cytidylyltransferase [Planctomycetes bacterium]|nr:2-C-methyl-D-erythritol 4-phosphate cytidylyltransferase [Planctomycetota bacterium]
MANFGVIICAGGTGERFGGRKKKPFVDVAGRTAFLRSVDFFADRDDVKQILIAISPEEEEMAKIKWGATLSFLGAKFCHGGAERFETVAKAMELINDDIDFIAVHDSVRCCLTKEWVENVFAEAEKTGAAMLACPVVATIKRAKDGKIVETVDRDDLYEAQTPQIFDAQLLKKAYANLENIDKSTITDDSGLVEALGKVVSIVETDNSNIKITRQCDVAIAEAIIKSRPKPRPDGPIGPYAEAQW